MGEVGRASRLNARVPASLAKLGDLRAHGVRRSKHLRRYGMRGRIPVDDKTAKLGRALSASVFPVRGDVL